jgi:hypothetical protein
MELLLKFLFVIVLIYYGMKLFLRYGMPWLLNMFLKKQQEKFSNMSGFSKSDINERPEGEVYIKTDSKQKEKDNVDDFGEYIDFEDVEEK